MTSKVSSHMYSLTCLVTLNLVASCEQSQVVCSQIDRLCPPHNVLLALGLLPRGDRSLVWVPRPLPNTYAHALFYPRGGGGLFFTTATKISLDVFLGIRGIHS